MKPAFSLIVLLSCASSVQADPVSNVAEGTSQAVGYVGNAVGDTVTAVGKGVVKTTKRITGDINVPAARQEIDKMAEQTLNRLFAADKTAKPLFDISYGYAIFDSKKTAGFVTLGSGGGVAIAKDSGKKVYMRMFTGGVNLGLGVQFYQNVFLFENKASFDAFVNSGWEAASEAKANFGRDSLAAQVKFVNGLAVYQLTDTGINLSCDLTGTKYYKDTKLN